jgi:hypothetical protein
MTIQIDTYPDFIMWLGNKDKVYINFIAPKGQMGTKDFSTEQYKEKVTQTLQIG